MRKPSKLSASVLSLFLAGTAWPAELGPELNGPEARPPLSAAPIPQLPPLAPPPDLSAQTVFQTPLLLDAAKAPQTAAARPDGVFSTFASPNPTASERERVEKVVSVFESSNLDHAPDVSGTGAVSAGSGGGNGGNNGNGLRAFKQGLAAGAVFVAAEGAGAVALHSMSLRADAMHSALDWALGAVGLAAILLARRHPEASRWRRAEPLVGLASAALIALTALEFGRAAYERFLHPEPAAGLAVAAVALCGIAAHLAPALALYNRRKEGVAMDGVFKHGLTDALGSLAVAVGGALAWAFGWRWIDPAVGAAVALLIAQTSWELGRRSWKALREKKKA